MSSTIGDDTTPIHEFSWEDGRTVRTDELELEESEEAPWDEIPFEQGDGLNTIASEVLAILGREDPECEVTLVGFE